MALLALPYVPAVAAALLFTVVVSPQALSQDNARIVDLRIQIDGNERVQVYIKLTAVDTATLDQLRQLDVEIEVSTTNLLVVQGWVPIARLDEVLALEFVVRISRPDYALPRSGSTLTEGDAILRADGIRQLGYLGENVKVGVISDGANARSGPQSSGDLPGLITTYGTCIPRAANAAQCDPGKTCNEGTAMLEIIHDMAPEAELAVAAVNTSLEFVQHAQALADEFGADVIVDDLGFLTEPFFADGPVAKGVRALQYPRSQPH